MRQLGVWEPFEVKAQTVKTAIEAGERLDVCLWGWGGVGGVWGRAGPPC